MSNFEKILIVDDNPANLKLARFALECEDFEVRTAANGEEALLLLRQYSPQLILMDIQLPGMDGLELTRRLKADPTTRDIVIVAVTAYAMKGDREEAISAGCDGYITKPVDPIELPYQVAEYLGRPRSGEVAPMLSPHVTPAGHSTAAESREGQATPYILIIEDNPTTRKMFQVTLESAGYVVGEVTDGKAALESVAQRRPDLIVQDLILPDMDGLELVRHLRELLGAAPVPIICVSGFLARFDGTNAIEAGFAHILVKPVDPFHLLDIVKMHLDLPGVAQGMIGQGRLLLIVDDDPLHRKLSQVWFSTLGFNVLVAEDGNAALVLARRSHPAAIVSDILMPNMDGFELCMAIRRDPDLAQIPIILNSGSYVEDADRALAMRVGASAMVTKSGGLEPIAAAVIQALEAPPPSVAPESVQIIKEEHTQRALLQLERQVRQNVRLLQRSRTLETQLTILAGVADALTDNLPIEQVLTNVLTACLDMAGISKGALYLSEDGRLNLESNVGFFENDLAALRDHRACGEFLHRIATTGGVVTVPSAEVPEEIAAKLCVDPEATSVLLVAVQSSGESYGLLMLSADGRKLASEDAQAFARVLGAQMGQAIRLTQTFKALSASQKRYRTLTENANDAICLLSPDGVIREANRRLSEIFGHPIEYFIGRRISDFAAPGSEQKKDAKFQENVAAGATSSELVAVRKRDGSSAMLDVSSAVVEIDGERLVFAILRDVTEQRHAQEQLMISDRMASIGTLAAGVAHEINNPLSAVIANLELALDDLPLLAAEMGASSHLDNMQESLSDARVCSDRIAQIVRDVKMFSRAEKDERGPVDVARVLDSSLRMAQNEILHRALLVKHYGQVPLVDANESRLGQVFLNLIVNAAQSIVDGHADSNEIHISTGTDASGRVCVEIRDTGPGMPPETIKKLFTPFFTTKPVGVGTGLGLAICKRILTEIGAEIGVESTVGVGTTFTVVLRPSPVQVAHKVDGPERVPATRRGQVLVVDDDPMVAAAIERVLDDDHEVTRFSNAQSALDLIGSGKQFDIILCDMMMPVVTGIQFYRSLLLSAPEQAESVIFLTGGTFITGAREFLDSVSNAHLEKPFNAAAIRNLVNERMGA